jgi:hypothetical protein
MEGTEMRWEIQIKYVYCMIVVVLWGQWQQATCPTNRLVVMAALPFPLRKIGTSHQKKETQTAKVGNNTVE